MTLRPAERWESLERTLIRRIFDAAPAGSLNLGLGQPDLATPETICAAGVAAIEERRTGYTPTAGDPELRARIAERYPTITPGPEGVLVTVGSQEALFVACLCLAEPGGELLVPDPGYPAYPTVARLVGARPVPYALRAERGFRLEADEVLRQLTARTTLVILCAPSNPTGACHPAEELERLVSELGRRGIGWISDEVYGELTYDGPLLSPARYAPAGGLVIGGLSKEASMTGWRVGWLVGPPEVIARAIAIHQHVATCASSISQRAALAALAPTGRAACAAWRERLRGRRAQMALALAAVPRARFAPPDGAFYYFVDVSAHGDSEALAWRILERRRVITIPGEAFGPRGAGHLRLSFAAAEDDIERGVRAIADELGA